MLSSLAVQTCTGIDLGRRAEALAAALVVAVLAAGGCTAHHGGGPSVDDGAGDADAAAPRDLAAPLVVDGGSVPPLADGALLSVQGVPTPQPGRPTPFVFVGCPLMGRAEVRLVAYGVDGVTERGSWIGTITRGGGTDHVVVPGDGGALIDVQFDEQGSVAVAPFEYRSTVEVAPTLFDVTPFSFVTVMLNPSEPSFDDVGLGEPFHLVTCE